MMKTAKKSARVGLFTGAGACALLCLSGGADAATTTEGTTPGTQVEELIVTAQKRSENIQQIPISIQAFSGKQLQNLGIKSSVDLGAVTPNVTIALVAGPGNQPLITIRGIGLNDYDTNNAGPNGVYVDEVYLSAPASQSFAAFDLNDVEVLKGPQGTLYGRNTSGGAINFVTNKPTDELTGNLHFEYSSYNTENIEGAISGPLTPTIDGRVAFVVNKSSGFVHNDLTGASENGLNNYAVRTMLQYKPTSRLKVLFTLHGGQVDNRPTEYRHIGDLNPATGGVCTVAQTYAGGCVDLFGYGTPKGFYEGAYNRTQHLKVNNLGASLRADYDAGEIKLTSISAFEHNDKLHPEDSDASPNRLLEINFGVRSNTFTQELRASETTSKFDWVAGLYFLTENLKQNQPLFLLLDGDKFFGGPGAADGVTFQAFDRSDQVTNAYAAFAQGDYNITDRLKLTLGARFTEEQKGFDYFGSVQFQEGGMDHFGPVQTLLPGDGTQHEGLRTSRFNWRAALTYHLAPDVLGYASVATGFKSGDFNGSFLSLIPQEIQRQLVPVLPETVTAYEIGTKASLFDHRLVFDAAAFYNKYDNQQVFVLINPPPGDVSNLPVNVLDNAKSAHTEGVEAQISAVPFQGLTASVQMGWLQARLDSFSADRAPGTPDYSGNQQPNSPHFSLSSLLDYKAPIGPGSLDFQFSATYKSHQFFDTTNDPYITQNGYWIENIRVAYAPTRAKWEVAGYVRNLSNQEYFLDKFDLTSPFGFIQGIMGTPRSYGVEANYKF